MVTGIVDKTIKNQTRKRMMAAAQNRPPPPAKTNAVNNTPATGRRKFQRGTFFVGAILLRRKVYLSWT